MSNYEFVQATGKVMLFSEILHDARIIPLDGRPHLPQTIRQWMGDLRGDWGGNTLVGGHYEFHGQMAGMAVNGDVRRMRRVPSPVSSESSPSSCWRGTG